MNLIAQPFTKMFGMEGGYFVQCKAAIYFTERKEDAEALARLKESAIELVGMLAKLTDEIELHELGIGSPTELKDLVIKANILLDRITE